MDKMEVAGYTPLIDDIKELIRKKQYSILQVMNAETINLYGKIGEELYRQQEVNGWGKSIVQVLSKEYRKNFRAQKVIQQQLYGECKIFI